MSAGPSVDLVQNVDENQPTYTAPPIVPFGDRLPKNNPYPDDTPEPMTRTYTIATGTWTNNDAPWKVLSNASPYSALWTKLQNVFNTRKWAYFHCKGVHLKLTISSTTYSSGGLFFCGAPYYNNSPQRNIAPYWFQVPHEFVDPAAATVFELFLPFLTPTNQVIQSDDWKGLGEYMLFVGSSLVDDAHDTDVASLDWRIEARFVEPHLSAQVDTITLPTNTMVPLTTVTAPSYITQAQGPTPKKEAQKKSETGLISGIAESVSTVAQVLTPVPIIGEVAAGINIVANAVGAVARWFGFSKPITQRALQPCALYAQWGDTHATGLTNATALSTDPDPVVATDPSLVRSDNDDASFDYLKKLPNLIYSGTIASNVAIQSKVFELPVNPLKSYTYDAKHVMFNHLSHLSSLFRYWRGTLNFKFYFPMSKMRKMRFALCWSPYPLATYNEDVRRIEFTTSESTTVDLGVPWCQISRYLALSPPINGSSTGRGSNGYLSLWVLDRMTVAGKGASVPQDYYVYMSGDEDLDFAVAYPLTNGLLGIDPAETFVPAEAVFTLPPTSPAYSQGALSGVDGLKIRGITAEDNLNSMREVAHRASYAAAFATSTYTSVNPYRMTPYTLGTYVVSKYLFWRGSRNYHFLSLVAGGLLLVRRNIGSVASAADSHDGAFAYQEGRNENWKVFNVPYLADEDCLMHSLYAQVSHATATPDIHYSFEATFNGKRFESFGDDLSLGIVVPSVPFRFQV